MCVCVCVCVCMCVYMFVCVHECIGYKHRYKRTRYMYTRRPFPKENAHNLMVEMHKWSEAAGMCVWGQYMKVGHVRWYERVCM